VGLLIVATHFNKRDGAAPSQLPRQLIVAQPRARRLTRADREQLSADLRLIPGRDEEELPFVFPDEPNQ